MSYVSIRTTTIRPKVKLLFDVYVQYKDTYLKYKAHSDAFEEDLLEKFKKKKIKKLFIMAEQERDYLKYLDAALDDLQTKGIALGQRADFAQDTLKQEAENIGKSLESEEAYKDSESRIQKVMEFMLNEPKALASMLASAGLSVDDSQHGATVSSLCLAVGAHSQFVDRDTLTDLAIASLLHDSTLATLGFDSKVNYDTLALDAKQKYRKHPQLAIESVSGKKFITARVLRLIEDHEEYGEGLGFPNKKRFAKLQVDSQIFNMCDALDHFAIQSGKSAKEAIEGFLSARAEHFDLELLEVLEKQVKA